MVYNKWQHHSYFESRTQHRDFRTPIRSEVTLKEKVEKKGWSARLLVCYTKEVVAAEEDSRFPDDGPTYLPPNAIWMVIDGCYVGLQVHTAGRSHSPP